MPRKRVERARFPCCEFQHVKSHLTKLLRPSLCSRIIHLIFWSISNLNDDFLMGLQPMGRTFDRSFIFASCGPVSPDPRGIIPCGRYRPSWYTATHRDNLGMWRSTEMVIYFTLSTSDIGNTVYIVVRKK